jgi:PAS domain S-box-containing protein
MFQGIVDTTGDLVAAHDARLRYVVLNGAYRAEFARLFGVELRIGDTLVDALAHVPRDRSRALDLARRALAGEAFTVFEELGDERRARELFEIRCAPLRDGRGKVIGAAHVLRDVTDIRRAEEALRALGESEARFRAAIDHFPGTFALYDADRRFRFVNATGLARARLREEELVGRREEDVFPPDVVAPYLSSRERAFETGETQRVEWRRPGPDGGRAFMGTFVPVKDAGGRTRQVLGLADEITDRKRAEDALKRSEATLAQAGEMAHLGAWWIDLADAVDVDRNALHWSDEVYRIFGYAPGEIPATNELFFAHVPAEDHPRIHAAVSAAMTTRRPYHLEHRVVRRDGAERAVLEHADVVFDGRRPIRIVGAILDITDRKRVEEALREADRRKNEFLGVLSHELRNPLAPVRNALWLLDHAGADGASAARSREILHRQVAHLSRIVDDLLDVTRITRGKVNLQRVRADLADLVRRTIDDHRTLFSAREVTVSAQLGALPIWVDADPTRVSQAVGNLLQNAAKFTNAGGHVEVSIGRDAQGRARLSVRDDGVGIDAALVARIFEPFTQGDEGLHRARGGLGLGLSLVKGLVELHGGSVEARSDGPGRGAEFVAWLPLASEHRVVSGEARAAGAAMAPRRVLVIEDNPDAAETLQEMLGMWGHEVAVAHDGGAGVDEARAFRPDVVLCDIGLPVMDGYQVARAIRADPEIASTFLVAVTGYALPDDQRRAADAGFDRHLGKPVPIEVMEEVLATAPRVVREHARAQGA